jgi:hypothetical protein
MHCYLFARCKTPDCKGKLFLAHQERPEGFTFIDYPDELFPLAAQCPLCRQTHSFSVKEVQTETSRSPHHPAGWKPLLGDPPTPQDIN